MCCIGLPEAFCMADRRHCQLAALRAYAAVSSHAADGKYDDQVSGFSEFRTSFTRETHRLSDTQAGEYPQAVALLAHEGWWEPLQKLSMSLDAAKHRDAVSAAAVALAGAGHRQPAKELFLRLADHQARAVITLESSIYY